MILLEIVDNDKTTGYFPCFILSKGPFRILGSPMIGWLTDFMGPIVNKGFNQQGFLDALEKYCRSQKIDQLELSNPVLDIDIMRSQGFRCKKGATYHVRLSPDEEVMWRNFKEKSCHWAINKAKKNNLIVEDTDDPKIINEYYDQLQDVFSKKHIAPKKWFDNLFYVLLILNKGAR